MTTRDYSKVQTAFVPQVHPCSKSVYMDKIKVSQELFKSSNRDGTNLYTEVLSPLTCDYSVVVVHCHGYAEYSNRYFDFAAEHEVLNKKLNACVCFIDHFGHGFSDGLPGYVDDIFLVTDDLIQYATFCKKKYVKANMKMVLLGNSMGGLLSLLAVRQVPDLFDLLILEGPLIIPTNPPNTLVIWAAQFLNLFASSLAMVDALQQLNTDPEIEKIRLNDPLIYQGKMRVGTGVAMQNGFLFIQNHLDDIKLPFLCLHGELDTACSVKGSKLLMEKAKSTDKKLILYPKQHHELVWEPDKEKIIGDLMDWITQRI